MRVSVKDVVRLFRTSDEINISWGGCLIPFDPENSLLLDAYGGYSVKAVHANGENSLEIDLETVPVKASLEVKA